jgi:hypothetical protein
LWDIIEKKIKIKKKRQKKLSKSQRVNLSNLQVGSWDQDNFIESKFKKLQSLIANKLNVEGWNKKNQLRKT